MRELICITCPKGCHLKVDEENGYIYATNAHYEDYLLRYKL